MMPTQEDWQEVMKRLEAVEKLTIELLQRMQRLELQLSIKPAVREVPSTEAIKPTELKTPTKVTGVSVKPQEPEELLPITPTEEAKPSVKPSPELERPSPSEHPTKKLPAPEPQSKPSRPAFEWEILLGGKFALWVGAILVLLAASFGIAYGWQFLGPVGRVLIGVLTGLTFIVVGEFAKGRTAKWFVEGVTALGLALLYLTIWAAAMRYRIVDFPIAFSVMSLITAFGVIASVRHDALSLILFATIGGFLTPVLLRTETIGANQALPFFGYITILNAGILATSAHKRWQVVNFVAFFATLLISCGWALFNYEPALRWQTFAFVTVNFLIFVGIGIAYPLRFREQSKPADLIFLLMVTSAYFVFGAWLLWQPLTSIAMPKLLALMRGALGIFPVILAAFWGLIGEFVRNRSPNDEALMLTTYGLSVGFLTIAMPMQFEGNPIAMAWAVEAAILTTISLRFSSQQIPTQFLRNVAELVWLLALATMLWIDLTKPVSQWRPVLNERFATFSVLVGSSAFIAREHWLRGSEGSSAMASIAASGLIFWLIVREVNTWFEWAGWFTKNQAEAAWLTVFGVWALVAALLVLLGLRPITLMKSAQVLGAIVLLIAALGTAMLSLTVITVEWRWIINPRFLNAVIVTAALVITAIASWRLTKQSEWVSTSFFSFAAAVLGMLAVSEEIYAGFWKFQFPSEESWEVAAWFCIFAFWGLAAVGNWQVGLRWRLTTLRTTGVAIWILATFGSLVASVMPEIANWHPIFNLRALAFAALIATGVALTTSVIRNREDLTEIEHEIWQPAYLGAAINFLALWVLTQETHFLFRETQLPSPETWGYAAQGAISVVWTIYATVAITLGIVKKWSDARWLGLVLLFVAVLKVFIVDLSFLTLPYRMVSFGVLGLILLGVAWAYSRYGELLRRWTYPDTT